jgi:hypothetical protein
LGNPQGEWIVAPTTIDHGVTIQELADIHNVAMVDEPHAATTAILTEDQILHVMGFKSETRRQFHQHFARNGDLLAKHRALFVTISTQRRDDKNKLWEGVVVSSRGILSSIFNGKKKFNAICVRLKRPHIHESKELSLHLAGYVTFGSPYPATAQVRRAIWYAMWLLFPANAVQRIADLAESRRLPSLNLNIGKIRVEMIILLLLEKTK